MKGLLRKDSYMLWSHCKNFILLIVVFTLLNLTIPNNAFYTIYPVVVVSMLPFTIISYEEHSKWDIYSQTLPLSRKQIVVEKYLFSALCSGTILLLSALVHLISMKLSQSFNLAQYINVMSGLLVLSLIGPGITLPLIFKLGCEKGRFTYYLVIGGACATAFLFTGKQLPEITLSAPILLVIVLAGYALSCLIAIRFYEKREI